MKGPAYEIAKELLCISEQHARLPYFFNTRNIVALLTDMKDIE